ncbi:MAG: ATP-binding protein [Deltaproteobacteria bacterium]|nr:ATP-binding protein [Deltaproteobacteria bacterium]
MAPFYDRDREQKELVSILEHEPSLVYFVYGPINSGKTSLLTKVLGTLPEQIIPFYVNLRGRDVSSAGDFLNVLFDVDRKSAFDTAGEYLKELFKGGTEIFKKHTGIPVPASIFDLLFKSKDKGADAFRYLEEFYLSLMGEGLKPIFILDELHIIKEVANSAGKPILEKLFNFFVRMTKETHLCHCIAATSDSLFIEKVAGNAKLEGRTRYFLVDDLGQKRAFSVYEQFKFPDKKLVWKYIGGKIGDMTRLKVELNLGKNEHDGLKRMLRDGVNRLENLLRSYRYVPPQVVFNGKTLVLSVEDVKQTILSVAEHGQVPAGELDQAVVCYLVEKNILFWEPIAGMIRPQGQLVKNAVKELKKSGKI